MKKRKLVAFASAFAVITSSLSLTAFAKEGKSFTVSDVTIGISESSDKNYEHRLNRYYYEIVPNMNNYVVDDPNVDKTPLPSKFDLRDVNGKCYVPEIRLQNPFGTCWSFGSTAAAEISVAYEEGADFNTMTEEEKAKYDFSELHTAWFAYEPVHEDDTMYPSQAGEGKYPIYPSDDMTEAEKSVVRLDQGALFSTTIPLYSAGIGPAYESEVPYINNEKKYNAILKLFTVDDEQKVTLDENVYNGDNVAPKEFEKKINEIKDKYEKYSGDLSKPGKYYYSSFTLLKDSDWTVDYSKKYRARQLDNASILPAPALEDENGCYTYNEYSTNAIKRELLSGRAVGIAFLADQSRPGQTIGDASYLAFLTKDGKPTDDKDSAAIWAQYTYDNTYDSNDPESINKVVAANHAVCIVGYDDDFPKEYFNDPNGTIGGNGAWVVRNSWGSKDNSVYSSRNAWGSGGTGYFYISYYDQSLCTPQSFDFRTGADEDTEGADGISINMYDLLPESAINEVSYDDKVFISNEFTSDESVDTLLTDVGLNTGSPNSTVEYDVYLLDEKSRTPTDGEKVASGKKTFELGGYHCVKLDEKVVLPKGQKYSVVASITREDGKNALTITRELNQLGNTYLYNHFYDEYVEEHGNDDGFKRTSYNIQNYSKAVVNKGESFVGTQGKSAVEWTDWSDIITDLKEHDASVWEAGFDYDNLSLRAYTKGNLLTVENKTVKEKKRYTEGDVIEGSVTIRNEVAVGDVYNIENIKLEDSLGAIPSEDAYIDCLASGESKTIKYKYTVTKEDVKAGSVTSTVDITVDGEPYSFVKELAKNSFTVLTAGAPGKPMNVKFGKDGNITWDAADKAVAYRVAKVVNGITYYGNKVTDTNYVLKKTPASDYKVYVIAYDEEGNTSRSDKLTVKDDKPLGYVNSLTVDENGTVAWDEADNAVAYRVGKVVNGKTYYGTKTENTSYQFKNLPKKDYQVFVVAYDADGRTAWGKKNLVEVGDLGAVFNTKVDKNGKVTWNAARNAAYYRVGKIVSGKLYVGAKTEDTSYTLAGVPETDYKVFVVAFDNKGSKVAGAVINVKVK